MGVGGTGGERPRRPQDRLRRKTLPNLRRKLPLALGPEGRLEVSGELDPWWPLRPCHPEAPASVSGARATRQTGLSFPSCLNWVLGARLVPGACSAWGGAAVGADREAAGRDGVRAVQGRWGLVYFLSPCQSPPRHQGKCKCECSSLLQKTISSCNNLYVHL